MLAGNGGLTNGALVDIFHRGFPTVHQLYGDVQEAYRKCANGCHITSEPGACNACSDPPHDQPDRSECAWFVHKAVVGGKPVLWHQRRLVPLPCTFAGVRKRPTLAQWLRLSHPATAYKNHCRATQRTLNIVAATAPQAVEDFDAYLASCVMEIEPKFVEAVKAAGYADFTAWVKTGAKLQLFEHFMVDLGFTTWDAVVTKTYK